MEDVVRDENAAEAGILQIDRIEPTHWKSWQRTALFQTDTHLMFYPARPGAGRRALYISLAACGPLFIRLN